MNIGIANCSRCGGADPNCYVCRDPKPERMAILHPWHALAAATVVPLIATIIFLIS